MPGQAGAITAALQRNTFVDLDIPNTDPKRGSSKLDRGHDRQQNSSAQNPAASGASHVHFDPESVPAEDCSDEQDAEGGRQRYDAGEFTSGATTGSYDSECSDLPGASRPRKRRHSGRRWSLGTSATSTDLSAALTEAPVSAANKVLNSSWFDAIIGMVIFSNAVAIGVEQSCDLEDLDLSVFARLEHAFLVVYLVELLVRSLATRGACFADNWVRFDAFLVFTSITCFWIIFPIMGQVQELEPFVLLRMLRLLRLARAVRLIALFRELWMLVHGLLVSGKTMLYTIMLIAIILYLFAVMSIELITKNKMAGDGPDADPVFQEQVELHFVNLPVTMMTLLQFVSFDNVVLIYEPLIKRDWKLAIFFILIIIIVGILLMNLVTAVVVNSALEQAMADKELVKKHEETQKKKLCKELRKVFLRLDEDASGQVTADEIQKISPEDSEMLKNMLCVSDPLELFSALDVDGSGEVDIEEFCNGIWQVCISKAPIEMKRVEKMVEAMRKQMRETEIMLNDMSQEILFLKSNSLQFKEGAQNPKRQHIHLESPNRVTSPKSAKEVKECAEYPTSWDQAPLLKDVQGDLDSPFTKGIQKCVRDAVREADGSGQLVKDIQACVYQAVHEAILELRRDLVCDANSAPFAVSSPGNKGSGSKVQDTELTSRISDIDCQKADVSSDVTTAPSWAEELTSELRTLRETGVKVALSQEQMVAAAASLAAASASTGAVAASSGHQRRSPAAPSAAGPSDEGAKGHGAAGSKERAPSRVKRGPGGAQPSPDRRTQEAGKQMPAPTARSGEQGASGERGASGEAIGSAPVTSGGPKPGGATRGAATAGAAASGSAAASGVAAASATARRPSNGAKPGEAPRAPARKLPASSESLGAAAKKRSPRPPPRPRAERSSPEPVEKQEAPEAPPEVDSPQPAAARQEAMGPVSSGDKTRVRPMPSGPAAIEHL